MALQLVPEQFTIATKASHCPVKFTEHASPMEDGVAPSLPVTVRVILFCVFSIYPQPYKFD